MYDFFGFKAKRTWDAQGYKDAEAYLGTLRDYVLKHCMSETPVRLETSLGHALAACTEWPARPEPKWGEPSYLKGFVRYLTEHCPAGASLKMGRRETFWPPSAKIPDTLMRVAVVIPQQQRAEVLPMAQVLAFRIKSHGREIRR